MSFYKKTLVLKEVLEGFSQNGKKVGGIARMERENGVTVFHLSLINLRPASDGKYFAYALSSPKDLCSIELGIRPTSMSKILETDHGFEKPLAVGIVYISNGIPALVAFGAEQEQKLSIADFKKCVLDKCILESRIKKESRTESPNALGEPEQKPPVPLPFPKRLPVTPDDDPYDDEVVACENFYLKEEGFAEKIKILEKWENDYVRMENGKQTLYREKTQEEMREATDCFQNEKNFSPGKIPFGAENPFFLSVKTELDALFSKFPEEETLTKTVPDGKWIKIPFKDDKYYVLGVVKKDGKEKYICYGVPSEYSATPPETLGNSCVFVPLSVFDLHGKGYWILFQDALTGKDVLPE